jgi:hypothetical protein
MNYNNLSCSFHCKDLWSKISLVFLNFGVTLASAPGEKINKKDKLPGILRVARENWLQNE